MTLLATLLVQESLCLFEVFFEVRHERRPAGSHARRIAGTPLMLLVDVAVGIVQVRLPETGQQADAVAEGLPEFRMALPASAFPALASMST